MKLFLFTRMLKLAKEAEKSGVYSIIVDWERKGKSSRQTGYNTEINADTPNNVQILSHALKIPITVRINSFGKQTKKEVDKALQNGAKIIMLPMAKKPEEVKKFLKIVDKRAKTLVQLETKEMVAKVKEFAKLKWDYTYIGLNDLMISLGNGFIWDTVLDGTVEKICKELKGREYGFGGDTVVGGGEPIEFDLLMHEYTRLGCTVNFMRRCFKKEILDRDMKLEIKAIKALIKTSQKRGPEAIEYDHQRLMKHIEEARKTNNSKK